MPLARKPNSRSPWLRFLIWGKIYCCPCAHYEGRWGSGVTAPRILNLNTMIGVSGPRHFVSLGMDPRFPLNRKCCGPQSRCVRFGEKSCSSQEFSFVLQCWKNTIDVWRHRRCNILVKGMGWEMCLELEYWIPLFLCFIASFDEI